MPAVGWALSWAVTQDIYMWPLHVSLSELPQNMAAGVQENKVDVAGLLRVSLRCCVYHCHCFLLTREVTDVNPRSQRGNTDGTTYSTEECQDI